MSSLSISSLVASFIFSVIGLYYFRQGKRELNFQLLFIAIVLIGYSYFISSPLATWGAGFALWGAAYYISHNS